MLVEIVRLQHELCVEIKHTSTIIKLFVHLLCPAQAALWLKGGWSKLALVVVDEQHK